jgi:hypothetical protein
MSGPWTEWEAALEAGMAALGEAALAAGVAIERAGVEAEAELERLEAEGRDAAQRFQEAAAVAAADTLMGLTEGTLAQATRETEHAREILLHPPLWELRNVDLPALVRSVEERVDAFGLGHETVRAMLVAAAPLEWANATVHMISDLLESMQLGL